MSCTGDRIPEPSRRSTSFELRAAMLDQPGRAVVSWVAVRSICGSDATVTAVWFVAYTMASAMKFQSSVSMISTLIS
jgi:hypothetical protein